MGTDIKGQINRGNANPDDWNQRKSEHEFKGAPEGMHVRTAVEASNAPEELVDLLTNPARLAEFVQPGDNLIMVLNRGLNAFTDHQPGSFGMLASLLRLDGDGPVRFNFFVYDHD